MGSGFVQTGFQLVYDLRRIERIDGVFLIVHHIQVDIAVLHEPVKLLQFRSGLFPIERFPMLINRRVCIEIGIPECFGTAVFGIIVGPVQTAVLIEKEFCIAESFSQHLRDIRDQLRGDRAGKRIARHIIEPE